MLLDLAEGRYRALGNLVRVFDLVLELLVHRTQIRLVNRLCALLGRARSEAQTLLFGVRAVNFGHERRWQRRLPLLGAPGHGRVVTLARAVLLSLLLLLLVGLRVR